MSRTPVPHSRPAALVSSPLLWAGTCGGCAIAKRGRKRLFGHLIQPMVDLVAAGHSQREAAKKLAGAHFDTLRRDYRKEARAGKLPKPSTHIDQRQAALQASFDERDKNVAEAKRELPAAEREAEALGLNLRGDLDLLDERLCSTIRENEEFLASPPEYQREHFMIKRISAEEAMRHLAKMDKELQQAIKQLVALRKVKRLRVAAWNPK